MRAETAPSAEPPPITALVPVGWDAAARRAAYDQTRTLAADDPEAATVLRAHLLGNGGEPGDVHLRALTAAYPDAEREGYSPTELYAKVSAARNWTPAQIDAIHFPLLFGLIREWSILAEEEEAASEARLAAYRTEPGTMGSGGTRPGTRLGPDGTPASITDDPAIREVLAMARKPRPYPAG